MLRASARAARRARHGAPKRATSSQSEAAAARSDRCAPDRPRARAVPPAMRPPPRRLATPRDVPSDPIPRDPSHNLTPTPALALAPSFSQNRASRRRERRRERRRVNPRPAAPSRGRAAPSRGRASPSRRHGGDDERPSSRRCFVTASRAVGRRGRRALAAVARRAAARSFLPGSTLTPAPARHTTAGFGEVWAVAARVAASGVFSSAGVPPPPSRASPRDPRGSPPPCSRTSAHHPRCSSSDTTRETPSSRGDSQLFRRPRHVARRRARIRARAGALPRETRGSRHADEGKERPLVRRRGIAIDRSVLVPANGAERSWMDGVSPSFRDLVERVDGA